VGKFEIRPHNSTPVKKPKFRRFGFSTGSKVQQVNLRALAKDMAEDPTIIVPRCAGKCSKCHFEKLLSRLRKIQAYRENADVLRKFASRGKQLEMSYAAMLLLATETSPIMFAAAKLPTGDVTYAVRGKAKKEFLIGLQHFDDPKLRLLAYSEIIIKKRLHLYSLEDELVCSGSSPDYPPELIQEVLKTSSYSLKKSNSVFGCEHSDEIYGFSITVLSAEQEITVCKSCTSRKQNLFTGLTSRVLARNPDDDFDIDVEHGVECIREGDTCTFSGNYPGTGDIMARYSSGEISDQALVEEYGVFVKESTKSSGKPVFLLGNRCYEDDANAFINALNPTEIEVIALKHVLKNASGPIIMETATPNAVLTLYWEKLGASAINSVIGDKELARKIFHETKDSGKVPSQILRDAMIQSKSKTALAALPDLFLSKVGKYLDDVARTYRALGKEETLKRIAIVQETKMKSINCGFLTALDSLKGKEWQFTKEELDYGKYLADFAQALLDSPAEGYADSLQNFLTASGSEETVR